MHLPPEYEADTKSMPAALRALLAAELAAGNKIVEVYHSHPAPPVGACFKLARPVTTRPRQSGDGIVFCERNTSLYSGEFTDAQRFYFIVEPPHPPPTEPDMDAIRAGLHSPADKTALELNQPASDLLNEGRSDRMISNTSTSLSETPSSARSSEALERFRESMVIDYERWREGIGYDIDALKSATPDEQREIERLVVARGATGWREIEALGALNSPTARALLRRALQSGNPEILAAILRHAPDIMDEAERTRTLVHALERAKPYEGLSETLLRVEEFHPPEVIKVLLRLTREGAGEAAVHFAAMLMFLHGKAESSFDWNLRPFFLRFNTEDPKEREAAYRELCERIGVLAGN